MRSSGSPHDASPLITVFCVFLSALTRLFPPKTIVASYRNALTFRDQNRMWAWANGYDLQSSTIEPYPDSIFLTCTAPGCDYFHKAIKKQSGKEPYWQVSLVKDEKIDKIYCLVHSHEPLWEDVDTIQHPTIVEENERRAGMPFVETGGLGRIEDLVIEMIPRKEGANGGRRRSSERPITMDIDTPTSTAPPTRGLPPTPSQPTSPYLTPGPSAVPDLNNPPSLQFSHLIDRLVPTLSTETGTLFDVSNQHRLDPDTDVSALGFPSAEFWVEYLQHSFEVDVTKLAEEVIKYTAGIEYLDKIEMPSAADWVDMEE